MNNVIEVQTENGVIHIFNPTSVEDNNTNEVINGIIAYPNPFNSSTRIEFTSNSKEETEFAIYSITGEKVFSLMSNPQSNNTISFIWNGKDMAWEHLAKRNLFSNSQNKKRFQNI